MNNLKPFHFGNHTDVGNVRHENEDFFGYFETLNGALFVVCDGMGGHVGGATASQLAVNAIKTFAQQKYYEDPNEMLNLALQFANAQIYQEAQQKPALRGMGTTCVALLVRDQYVYYAHVGDSRLYFLPTSENLRRITTDHSFVQLLVDKGIITEDDAEMHPRKNELLRALGTQNTILVDVSPEPIAPNKGDIFLLCTDGLSGSINDNLIMRTLRESTEVQAKALQLVRLANSYGGDDNITVQIVEFIEKPQQGTHKFVQNQDNIQDSFNQTNPLGQTQPDINTENIWQSPEAENDFNEEELYGYDDHEDDHDEDEEQEASLKKTSKKTTKNKTHKKNKTTQKASETQTETLQKWGINWEMPKNGGVLLSLTGVAVIVSFIYFSPLKESLKQKIIQGKSNKNSNNNSKQDTTKHYIEVKGKDSTLARRVQQKAIDYLFDKSPMLRGIVDKYNQVNKTIEQVENTVKDVENKLNFKGKKPFYHQLQTGDNLKKIADKYKISLIDLKRANYIEGEEDLIGLDSLLIPEKKSK